MSEDQLSRLSRFAACDVADALLKLEVPGAGFLANIAPLSTSASSSPPSKVIAPASTVLLVSRSTPSFPSPASNGPISILNQTLSQPLPNIPEGTPYSDLTTPETIVVISQPHGQKCAVVGGIMALRMKKLGAKAIVVDGRVRDLETMHALEVPVWAKGTSIIGAGAETKAWATNVPIHVDNTVVDPGDIIMIDPTERGAVCIPLKLLDQVLDLIPKLVAADEAVLKDVEKGGTVQEAFKKHRGK